MLDKIKDIIEKLVEKITGDDRLFENFKSNPIETVKKLIDKFDGDLDLDLNNETLDKIVDGIKAKLLADKADDAMDKVGDLLGGLFGKK